jgi:hypothetical protein
MQVTHETTAQMVHVVGPIILLAVPQTPPSAQPGGGGFEALVAVDVVGVAVGVAV